MKVQWHATYYYRPIVPSYIIGQFDINFWSKIQKFILNFFFQHSVELIWSFFGVYFSFFILYARKWRQTKWNVTNERLLLLICFVPFGVICHCLLLNSSACCEHQLFGSNETINDDSHIFCLGKRFLQCFFAYLCPDERNVDVNWWQPKMKLKEKNKQKINDYQRHEESSSLRKNVAKQMK